MSSSTPARPTVLNLGPIEQLRAPRLPRRLTQMTVGLCLYGLSLAMMLRGGIGLAPWDVLHSGLASHLPLTIGQTLILVSGVVLLLWIPLKEVPGIATFANAVLIGLSADASLAMLPPIEGWHAAEWALRIALMLGGIVLCGFSSACYIGAQLGRGARDGLMTGLARRTGASLRAVRTGIEITVVVLGLVLGGVAGVGTLLFALAIGPIIQLLLPFTTVDVSPGDQREGQREGR